MKNLISLRLLSISVFLLMMLFAACEKDEIQTVSTEPIEPETTTTVTSPVVGRLAASGTQPQSSSATGGLEIECIGINYPFDFDVDGVIYTINNIGDIDDLFTNVVGPNTMSIDFVYPLNITLEDGSAGIAADEAELSFLVSECVPNTGWNIGAFPAFFFDDPTCISINYPVALLQTDSTQIVAADQSEFVNLLAANPDVWFEFPLNVEDPDGTVFSIQDQAQLFDILAACADPGTGTGHGGHGDELSIFLGLTCFSYNYPISILDYDGNTISVSNTNELSAIILNGDFANFVYSFTVSVAPDSVQVTISNEADFEALFQNCFSQPPVGLDASSFIISAFTDSCYALVYPFNIAVNGVTEVISTEAEANAFAASNVFGSILFPINVVYLGQITTLNNEQDYDNLLANCSINGLPLIPAEFFLRAGIDSIACYNLIYPVTITVTDSTSLTLNTETEVLDYLPGPANNYVALPTDVIDQATGEIVTFQIIDDFLLFISNCQ